MGVRYIGSKVRVAEKIARIVGDPVPNASFVDGFCGTGPVAESVAANGWSVRLNDHLLSSATMAAARLIGEADARFEALGGYANAVSTLNQLDGIDGFIHREYTPASIGHSGVERRYFSVPNGRRLDAVRSNIRLWHEAELISDTENQLLIADLMVAANRVANIAGTYGCFLRDWSPQALHELELAPRRLRPGNTPVELHVGDVSEVPIATDDVVYYDPPYTKRQYAAYYHLLETIAHGDEPEVGGITGLRPWKHLASDFCYRTRALRAITDLMQKTPAKRVLLSYSSEGHVDRPSIEFALCAIGKLTVHELGPIGRYRPNRVANAGSGAVSEYIFELEKASTLVESLA
ncbi:DNA adenine methylase [Gordonia jinhuaensis]|uniref:Restriction endonuclease subunit M n=1 Tax=Gordonia jinhuaensis TaxID=1517702 RepID=A0A916TJ02_9ACTN|nr:DNA adenine methylase [Gordonia jinhuaensis]GGB47698.1 restriction endonuclease subunit M [Gordonia jinhuaensis]